MGKVSINIIKSEADHVVKEQKVASDTEIKKCKLYKQKFRKLWLEDTIFKDWLREVPENAEKAYCTFCNRYISAKYSDLLRHINSKKHTELSPAVSCDLKVLLPLRLNTLSKEKSNRKDLKKLSTLSKWKIYKQRFRRLWLEDITFKDWLREVPEDTEKAYCTFCDRFLCAKHSDLLKHVNSKQHIELSPVLSFDIKILPPLRLKALSKKISNRKDLMKLSTLCKMTVDDYLKIIRSLARIPTLKSAVICNSASEDVLIEACWTTRNLSSKERITSENHYVFKNFNVVQIPASIRDRKIILKSFNENGDKHAYICQDDDMYHLGIIDASGEIVTLNLKDLSKHGKVYSDPELSSLVFSPDSSHLVFVAEKKRENATSFLDAPPKETSDGWGQKHVHHDNWGEQMEEYHQSVLVVVNIESEEITVLDFPKGLTGGHLIWTPDSTRIVGTAYITEPFRLGLIYCTNRESFLFEMDLKGNFEELTRRNSHVQSPRFKPDGSSLVFFRCDVGGPHVPATQLCIMEWESREINVLVDFVSEDEREEEAFTGFTGFSNIPRRCWSKDSSKLVVNNIDNFETTVILVDAEIGLVSKLSFTSSFTAHDWKDGWLLLSASSITEPTRLFMWKEDTPLDSFIQISEDISIDGIPKDWVQKYRCNKITSLKNAEIPVIYCGPTEPSKDKRPLIVWPHGGPHSMIPNAYNYQLLFYLRLGYSIVFPNYRGSLGQGKDALESLPGHVGIYDVNDVHAAALDCLKRFSDILDPNRVVLVGGSHGGFLVSHLSAVHPDFYKAVQSRNPVIDIASMAVSSDIPDWCFVEAGVAYNPGKTTSLLDMAAMRKASPIHIIKNVKAPTLFLLGKNDKRVPMEQGMHCYNTLKANGVETSVFVYDDSHPLAKVEVEADTLIQTALWFDRFIR